IGQNPTPRHNKYFVMTWDFSNVSPQGDAPNIQQALHRYVNRCIEDFADYYQTILPKPIHIEPNDAVDSFLSLLSAVRKTPYKLYLLIDEYDNFANEVLMGHGKISPSRYKSLLSAEGSLKTIFKAVKSASGGQGLERVFLTGVSPVLMSDITSAYNVAKNIYLRHEFNDLCGFKENEIKDILTKIVKACGLTTAKLNQALRLMQTFYDGYCFSDQISQEIYNPTLALYFLEYFQTDCEFPRQMLDDNLAIDRKKLSYISDLPNGEPIIVQALNETPPLGVTLLANRFGVDDMLNATKDSTFIISLLYYLGVLTFNGKTDIGDLRFKIPNLVVRKLYVERLLENFLPQESERSQARQFAKDFYKTGDLQPICDLMEQDYFKVLDNRDYRYANELTIKTAFLTVLYDDVFYIMDSEMPLQRRYADLTMILRSEQRQYALHDFILEFKYLKLSELELSGDEVRELTIEEIKALEPVKDKLAEAKKQLLAYQKRLDAKYGKCLRLQLISVVAIGFDR
ncbi:MAG TPA: AAA family ATPase, partial [Thiotrichaceae bacterium]|nr:AAA family ATPase [Thiotrichaceae bacterium]